MKFFRRFSPQIQLALVALLFCSVLASDAPKTAEPPSPVQCNKEVLGSYMLKGKQKSVSTEKMFLCPDIKSSCCTKIDQQRIYHVVNDILPPRFTEYLSKIKMALAKLKNLHKNIVKANPVFTGSAKRRTFCGQQARKVYNFPFNNLHTTLTDELELLAEENKEHYQKFYCILCDAENHSFIDLKSPTPKITFDVEFCKEFLSKRTDVLKILNIELVDYLVSLQNLVDCTHYVKSYNLNFFDASKIIHSKETSECLNFMNGKNFLKYCKPLCERIRFSKVTEMIDGDFEFIIDAVNLFEKFFEFKETGNFISMKLRLFFKKFVIPRTLTKNAKAKFLGKLKAAENKKKKKKQKAASRKLKTIKATPKKTKNDNLVKKTQKGKRKLVKSKGRKERKLFLVDGENANQRFLVSNNMIDKNLGLINEELKNTQQHIDAAKNKSESQQIVNGNQSHLSAGRMLAGDVPKKPAKLIYDKELYNFYEEIGITKPDKAFDHIFKIQPEPTDFDKPLKVYSVDTGINPDKYNEVKFNLDKEVFYKMLFEFRKSDLPDPNLAFFIADFSPAYLKDMKIDLKTDFTILKQNYNIAKPKKAAGSASGPSHLRRLSEATERALTEDFAQKVVFGSNKFGL